MGDSLSNSVSTFIYSTERSHAQYSVLSITVDYILIPHLRNLDSF